MKAIRFLSMLLAALLVTSLCCFGAFAAEKVVFVADGGDDSAAGTSEAPVKTFAKAVEMLGADGGTLVVMGVVTIEEGNSHMPESGPITVTSVYGGVDYRAKTYATDTVGARIVMKLGKTAAVGFQLRGDYVFDAVSLCVPDAGNASPVIASSYHNFTVTDKFQTLYEDLDGNVWFTDEGQVGQDSAARTYPPIYLLGYNKDMSDGGLTITGNYTVDISAGDWYTVRVGDRDLLSRNTLDCQVTVQIRGGKYFYWTGKLENQTNSNTAIQGLYQACTTANFRSTVNVTGGTIYGSIAAFGSFGIKSAGDCVQAGTVTLNILNCTLARSYNFDYNYVIPTMYTGEAIGSFAVVYEDTATVNINIDNTKVLCDPMPDIKICTVEGLKVNIALVEQSSHIIADGYNDIKYGPLSATDTDPVPVTTEQPVEPTPETTPATTEAGSDVTPPTGDYTLFVLFAAATVLCAATIVILKKKAR